jgi:hypothetical protein
MKWIDSGDIKNWANGKQRHCAQTLPELIRRLILATAGSIDEIEFPSGDSITTGGWDGRLKTDVISPFFPSGVSGWEMGAEKSAQSKAETDYAKRTANPLGLTRKETTFVFVTPRSWPRRDEWRNKKRGSRKWKDVRVMGADLLEQWLDSAPVVALWLSRQIGKVVSGGVRHVEGFWEEWSLATNPQMTTDLVGAGRLREIEQIHRWITDRPGILSVQGDSPDEAFAFLYAAIVALSDPEREQALSRSVVVENIGELRQLVQAFQNPLIIAAPGQCIEAAGAATARGHHIFLSMDAKVIDIGNVLRLSRPQHSVVEKSLHQNGLSEKEAQRIAREFGRSIPVLRRQLYRSKAFTAPIWSSVESARLLIPVLLAGSWDEGKEGDRKVLTVLSGLPYENFARELQGLLSIDDSPIRKIGSVWMLKSPLDAWFVLARNLNNDSLVAFQQSTNAVLMQVDPKYDLSPEKRWAAPIYGKSRQYSEWLRTGLIESLVLLAIYGDRSPGVSSPSSFVNKVVTDIFGAAHKWEVWASLKDVTPLLAEAAPDSFLEIVQSGIAKTPALFQELMRDEGDAVLGECKHSGLLWALESTAWSSQYFARTVSVLADLADIDTGGRWNNRPLNSLRDIFLPGLPQTFATPEERLAAFSRLATERPKLAWTFAQGYYHQGAISVSHRFRWRDDGGERRGLEAERNEDYQAYLNGLIPKLEDLACVRENLVSSVSDFIRLPSGTKKRLIAELEGIDPALLSREERDQLLRKIRETLNWINSYGDENILTDVPALNRILEKLTPKDVLERVGWVLSDPWPRLPQGESKNYETHDENLATARQQAAREVLNEAPLDKILNYAATIQYVGIFGHALGKVVRDETEDDGVLDAILGRISENPGLLIGYALGRVEATNRDWVKSQVERMKAQGKYSAEACALLYLGLPEGRETWLTVNAHGQEVERAYWKRARGYSRTDKVGDSPIAIEKLLDAKRPVPALELAGAPTLSAPSSLLQRLIQELLSLDPKEGSLRGDAMTDFYLGRVFNQLYERNELTIEEIARLEWPFAALFDELRRYTSSPLAIHRVLQKDPCFFAQLISLMYRRDDRVPDPDKAGIDEEQAQRTASNARNVVDSWRLMPGMKEDGSIDETLLTEWVESARQHCAMSNRVTGGDLQIGFMLARYPGDADGRWPHVAVRNLIERLNNQIIDEHICIGVYNSRGVVSRGLTDGGTQERQLSENYRKASEAVMARWPRTGAMLRSIADSYERDARRQDVSSDLLDLRLN